MPPGWHGICMTRWCVPSDAHPKGKGRAMRNYGIIGTLVAIILIIVILRLLGVF